jgi:hypothetical protein
MHGRRNAERDRLFTRSSASPPLNRLSIGPFQSRTFPARLEWTGPETRSTTRTSAAAAAFRLRRLSVSRPAIGHDSANGDRDNGPRRAAHLRRCRCVCGADCRRRASPARPPERGLALGSTAAPPDVPHGFTPSRGESLRLPVSLRQRLAHVLLLTGGRTSRSGLRPRQAVLLAEGH